MIRRLRNNDFVARQHDKRTNAPKLKASGESQFARNPCAVLAALGAKLGDRRERGGNLEEEPREPSVPNTMQPAQATAS